MGFFSRDYLQAASIGLHLVISTFVGLGIGYWLDRFFNSAPWLTLIFLLLGIASGFMEMLKMVRKENRGPDSKD